ncbi:MAG: cob(I)yrinic acid a,c-diamide adenosyltransferase, partial [Candidatus Roizmanbacteria bacterium]
MSIYTKTGDEGTTSLFGGNRVIKSDPQIEACGSIDEVTSFVGMVNSKLHRDEDKDFFIQIQKDLYTIMGYLAGAEQDLKPLQKQVILFEKRIDIIESSLPKLNRFIIPGGSEMSSLCHVVRSVIRRGERRVAEYLFDNKLNEKKDSKI